MTFGWGEVTGGEMTMGRNDRIPLGLLFYLLLNPLTFNLDRSLILSKDIDPDAWLILIVALEDINSDQ